MVSDGTEGAGRVADVLLRFVDGPQSWGVSAMARELDLSKAVVHRIMRSLVDRGMLTIDATSRTYQLGPAAAAIGARALRDSKLRRVSLPLLRELQTTTGETTTLSARVHRGRVYLDQVVSTHEINMTVELGRRFPLHAGGSGRAILAFLPPDEREAVLHGELPTLTSATTVDPERLRGLLVETRRVGVADSGGERQPGAGSVAAPIFDLDGQVVGSISVCGPIHRLTPDVRHGYGARVAETADRISRALGWRGGLPPE
ncbi:IclR family transcriptional regulator [Cryptosporangium phraense]|uniref:IclR family transcriptional regulator n=1 Tax=Cryptosporangium phraense TaxID=2593070 RepID=A0A545AX14_9ACTN|nr:IclR family transcriptional regulator [Cryptosporangium phraense]TQS45860.1 IclR family transcriptional regulator [Cryptosporangium phraense]